MKEDVRPRISFVGWRHGAGDGLPAGGDPRDGLQGHPGGPQGDAAAADEPKGAFSGGDPSDASPLAVLYQVAS